MSKITRQIWADPQQDRFAREVIHELEGVVPTTIVEIKSQADHMVIPAVREPVAIELLRIKLTTGSSAEVPDHGSATRYRFRPELGGCLIESVHGLTPSPARYQFTFRLTWSEE